MRSRGPIVPPDSIPCEFANSLVWIGHWHHGRFSLGGRSSELCAEDRRSRLTARVCRADHSQAKLSDRDSLRGHVEREMTNNSRQFGVSDTNLLRFKNRLRLEQDVSLKSRRRRAESRSGCWSYSNRFPYMIVARHPSGGAVFLPSICPTQICCKFGRHESTSGLFSSGHRSTPMRRCLILGVETAAHC